MADRDIKELLARADKHLIKAIRGFGSEESKKNIQMSNAISLFLIAKSLAERKKG